MLKKFFKSHFLIISIALLLILIITSAIVFSVIKSNKHEKINEYFNENISLLSQPSLDLQDSQLQQSEVENREPLTFTVDIKHETKEGYQMEDGTYVMGEESTKYVIIPSYYKDVSEWTDEEKEAYNKLAQEIAKKVKDDFDNTVAQENQKLQELEEESRKIETSQSKYYNCGVGRIAYNSYTRKYSGNYIAGVTRNYYDDSGYTTSYDERQMEDTSAEDFRNNIYPVLLQIFEQFKNDNTWLEEEVNEYGSNLNEVYHLSD